ncbi:MAG TPA: hypothetical protein H9781_02495, partial [Candidatus Oscillibacter excrementavium]|nr:hypothetical protein [Candidatus Oscillibacter excrementavium]
WSMWAMILKFRMLLCFVILCKNLLGQVRAVSRGRASKRFGTSQNLAAGRIHSARGCSIKGAPAKPSGFVGIGLAVVDMGDDRKVSDVALLCHMR